MLPLIGWGATAGTLRFADTIPDYAALIKVDVPRSTFDALDHTPVAPFIFRSGTTTAKQGRQ